MIANLRIAAADYKAAWGHLRGHVEQVGFFLAVVDATQASLELRHWRPMPPEAFDIQTDYHVTLRDDVRPEVIKWAWDAGLCLVEVHSHGLDGGACFSPSDLWGLDVWVPHVRWRLRGRPYAAIVVDGDTLDALAWCDDTCTPKQVGALLIDDGRAIEATGATLRWQSGRAGH